MRFGRVYRTHMKTGFTKNPPTHSYSEHRHNTPFQPPMKTAGGEPAGGLMLTTIAHASASSAWTKLTVTGSMTVIVVFGRAAANCLASFMPSE